MPETTKTGLSPMKQAVIKGAWRDYDAHGVGYFIGVNSGLTGKTWGKINLRDFPTVQRLVSKLGFTLTWDDSTGWQLSKAGLILNPDVLKARRDFSANLATARARAAAIETQLRGYARDEATARAKLREARKTKVITMTKDTFENVVANYRGLPEVLAMYAPGETTVFGHQVPATALFAASFMPVMVEEPARIHVLGYQVMGGTRRALTIPTTFVVYPMSISGMVGETGHPHVYTSTGALCNGTATWPFGNMAGMMTMLREFVVGHQDGHAYDRSWTTTSRAWWAKLANREQFRRACELSGKAANYVKMPGEHRRLAEFELLTDDIIDDFLGHSDDNGWRPPETENIKVALRTPTRLGHTCSNCGCVAVWEAVINDYKTIYYCGCCLINAPLQMAEKNGVSHPVEEGRHFFGKITNIPTAILTSTTNRVICGVPICDNPFCVEHPAVSGLKADYLATLDTGQVMSMCTAHRNMFRQLELQEEDWQYGGLDGGVGDMTAANTPLDPPRLRIQLT